MIGLWVLFGAVVLALAVGVVLRRRSGTVRTVDFPRVVREPENLTAQLLEAGLMDEATATSTAPLILHFSATWCGPCAGVRTLVDQLSAQLPAVRHVEVDVTEHHELAAELRVLSLPTVLVYDGSMQQRFRVSGAPTATDLRAAVLPLLDGPDPAVHGSG